MEEKPKEDELKTTNPTIRELDLEISPEVVKKEYEKILKEYTSKAKLPGFRKGYAPKEMVQRMFEAEIKEAVLDNLIPENLQRELEVLNIRPVSVPTVKSVDFDLEKGIKYRVSLEIWPEFSLPDNYLDNKIKKPEIKIDDSEIDRIIKNLQEKAAEYLPVNDRGAKDGDYAIIEIQGKDLASKKYLPLEKVAVLIGHSENEPQLNKALAGMKPGEEKVFQVNYPEDYQQKKFAGKQIEYRLKLLEIKEKKLPELNDDFAQSFGAEVASLEEMKSKIRQDLTNHLAAEARERAIHEFLQKLATAVNLTLPESLVKEEAQSIISQEFTREQLQKMPREIWPQIAEEARKKAEDNLRYQVLLKKIAEKEGLSVSEEELEEDLKKASAERHIPLDQLKAALNRENRLEDWKYSLLLNKVVDFLANNIIIE
ncbi:MAG TPA: trigger factor [Candidatus Aminicenantes bacterium]|nr:MAG: trigger factor [Candidatus Aminicenantes bacterium]HEK86705.1 trigger factor [Candidatus Aminicenantes bacterium]